MIKRWVLTFSMMAMGIVLLSAAQWFETQALQIDQVTKGYKDDLREIRSISETHEWIERVAIPYFASVPMSTTEAELDMIRFFDRHAKTYRFKVEKFVYYEGAAKMDIGFSFVPKNQDDIARFLAIRYDQGWVQLQKFGIKEGEMSGTLTLIQPVSGEFNASR